MDAVELISRKLADLEDDVELIKAKLNIKDTEESKREKEHHNKLFHIVMSKHRVSLELRDLLDRGPEERQYTVADYDGWNRLPSRPLSAVITIGFISIIIVLMIITAVY
jgi:hypothetical protein